MAYYDADDVISTAICLGHGFTGAFAQTNIGRAVISHALAGRSLDSSPSSQLEKQNVKLKFETNFLNKYVELVQFVFNNLCSRQIVFKTNFRKISDTNVRNSIASFLHIVAHEVHVGAVDE